MVGTTAARFGLSRRDAADASDDATLVRAAQRDRQAFAPLYARYFDAIYGYCAMRLHDRELAEDAMSIVFSRALAGLNGCRPDRFRSWLFTIAHHAIVDAYRRPSPEQPLLDTWEAADPAATPEDAVIAAEARRDLAQVLGRLPEDQRRVMELRLSGLTGPEIAAVLGRSPLAVRSLQFRAMTRLRTLLGHDPRAGS